MIFALDHVQLTVPAEKESAALSFYRDLLGLEEIAKPDALKKNGGAWFRIGAVELHISSDATPADQQAASKRHVCLLVRGLEAYRRQLERRGAEIIEDKQPLPGIPRFYLRDPGGNRIEIAKKRIYAVTDKRPACIVNQADIRQADDAHYPSSTELLSIGSPFSDRLGLTRIGIHHELLPPGRRTSYPHAESDEEEFVYVIEGEPDVWLDGHLHPLKPGDGVGFPAGTGLSHSFINNSKNDVRLLVVGERGKKNNRILYPMNPERIAECGASYWHDAPKRPLGPHSGKPD